MSKTGLSSECNEMQRLSLSLDSFWHVAYILFLFIGTTTVWDLADADGVLFGLLNENSDRWYPVLLALSFSPFSRYVSLAS